MRKKRNGEIDVFRFVFSILIVGTHFQENYSFGYFTHGYIGVEFFFLVSGFLMARHVFSMKSLPTDSRELANETWRFVIRKIQSFYWYYCTAMILWLVVLQVILRHHGLKDFLVFIIRGLPQITLTFMGYCHDYTGLYVGNTWYLSAMMIGIILLYPFLLKNRETSTKLFFPLLAMVCLCYLYKKNNSICVTFEWNGFVYLGLVRAIAEMACGASLYALFDYLKDSPYFVSARERSGAKVFLTLLKYGSYGLVVLYGFGVEFGGDWSIHAFLYLMIAVTLSFLGAGYTIPGNALTNYLGKISLPIFLFHGFLRHICRTITGVIQLPAATGFALIAGSVVVSVVFMYITDGIYYVIKSMKKGGA